MEDLCLSESESVHSLGLPKIYLLSSERKGISYSPAPMARAVHEFIEERCHLTIITYVLGSLNEKY